MHLIFYETQYPESFGQFFTLKIISLFEKPYKLLKLLKLLHICGSTPLFLLQHINQRIKNILQ